MSHPLPEPQDDIPIIEESNDQSRISSLEPRFVTCLDSKQPTIVSTVAPDLPLRQTKFYSFSTEDSDMLNLIGEVEQHFPVPISDSLDLASL